ncbi:MAG TPA: hypothetical protein VGI90_18560 [Steroidobacteraceae bacterium]|jgi:hypothetical protein
MSVRIKNIVVVALLLLAVNFAFCAALMRAQRDYAMVQVTLRMTPR